MAFSIVMVRQPSSSMDSSRASATLPLSAWMIILSPSAYVMVQSPMVPSRLAGTLIPLSAVRVMVLVAASYTPVAS